MKQKTTGVAAPIALICINKSRLKVYHKETNPTYYLEKGQEFQIELFNPTSDTVLAKIELNGNQISQGGLVLNPGQRVFLERYLDVAKKFLFDTYEVANTEEVKKAIENNGDVIVKFYREENFWTNNWNGCITTNIAPSTLTSGSGTYYNGNLNINSTYSGNITLGGNNTTNTASSTYISNVAGSAALYSNVVNTSNGASLNLTKSKATLGKNIETGRVESGSNSDQKFEYVNKSFNNFPFHIVEYKLLPTSQKINTSEDLNVKRYCTNCGAKLKKEYKFCPSCGAKS